MTSDVVPDKVMSAVDGLGYRPHLVQSDMSQEREVALREMMAVWCGWHGDQVEMSPDWWRTRTVVTLNAVGECLSMIWK